MTIVSMFATLLLTATLGMVMNMGRQLDAKIRMQNAADSAALAGGTLMARSMNAMAFCNHLVPDVMSLVAFFREADRANMRRSAMYTTGILDVWRNELASKFNSFTPSRVQQLATAIPERANDEQSMIDQWLTSVENSSTAILPSLEQILRPDGDTSHPGLIPLFQQALFDQTQTMVSEAPGQMAREHLGSNAQGVVYGYKGTSPPANIPVANTQNNSAYMGPAVEYRNLLARRYLRQLNHDYLWYFDEVSKLSRFDSIWSWFTCSQMNQVLSEHANTNLPWVLDSLPAIVPEVYWDSANSVWRTGDEIMEHPAIGVSTGDYDSTSGKDFVEQHFCLAGVVANPKITELSPRLFSNPYSTQTQAFAQVMIYIPRPRIVYGSESGGGLYAAPASSGNVYVRQIRPIEVNLYNQNWQAKLVPATAADIFSVNVTTAQSGSGISSYDFQQLTNH